MINQELVSFVQNSLQRGETKEKIISDLLSNNWTLGDIKECFTSLNIDISSTVDTSSVVKNNQGNSKKTILISVLLLSLISISALGYYFRDSIPVIKDLVKSDTSKVEELTQDQINKEKLEETQKEQIETPAIAEEIQKEDTKVSTPVVENKIVTTKTVEINKKDDLINMNIKTEVTQTVDCGSEDCFQKKFVVCQPATLKTDAGFAAVDYKIIEPVNDGCKMTFSYTKNPNPKWVNKEMTCTFDNKIGFEESVQKAFMGVLDNTIVCSGPLYTILKSM